MGPEFGKLHPKLQEWFGFTSYDRVAAHGSGTLERVWRGGWYTLPCLWIGQLRNIMCTDQGVGVPFTVSNYAFKDDRGDETTAIIRNFELERERRFDEYMIGTNVPGRIVNYLGTHQHFAVDLDLAAGPKGEMIIKSGKQHLLEGPLNTRFPRIISADAHVVVEYEEDLRQYHIRMKAANPIMGAVFGYEGLFNVEWHDVTPDDIRKVEPVRTMRI